MTISETLIDGKGYLALSLFRLGAVLPSEDKTLSMEYKERAQDIRKSILEERLNKEKTPASSQQQGNDIEDEKQSEEDYEKLIVWMLW